MATADVAANAVKSVASVTSKAAEVVDVIAGANVG